MTAAEQRPSPRRAQGSRKAQIAAIAAEMFCERGYHSVGLSDIAAEAGITGPAIYRHFPNKQALLGYAAQDLATAITACGEQAPDNDDPAGRLQSVVAAVARLVFERRRSFRLYQRERRYLEPADRADLMGSIADLLGRIARLLRELRPELAPAQADVLCRAAFSALASLSTHRVSAGARAVERTLRAIARGVLCCSLPTRVASGAGKVEPVPSGFAGRRERLLTSALPLFRERGFHAVNMEDIGEAAGISASSVYRHFPSKAALLAAIYYRAADRLAAATAEATGTDDPERALHGLVAAYVGFTLEQPDLAAVYLSEQENLPADDRHALRRAQREHVDLWVRLVATVRTDGRTVRTRLLVHAALNVVHDLAVSRRRDADAAQLRYLVHTVLATRAQPGGRIGA